MTKTLTILTISLLTTVLITGGLSAIPYAYSSGPDTLTVKYLGQIADEPVTTIQIYKKIDDFGNPPLGPEITITNDVGGDEFMVISQNYGKNKLNSNTVFRILEDGGQIDVAEIHTSCSKPLYIGQIVNGQGGQPILEVVDGTLGGDSILPNNSDEKCIDNKDSKHTATITLKKAITNDNGATIPDNLTETFLPKIDGEFVLFGEPIPITEKEPHTISEATNVQGFSFVLIAGDTECPSMLGEPFTVKKNKEITCTIYNDDNFVPGQGGGDGVTFGLKSLKFKVGTSTDPVDPTSATTAGINSCHIPGATVPCIANLNESFQPDPPAGADKDQWLIVDPVITETSIFVFTLIPPFDEDALVPVEDDGEVSIDLQVHTCITAGVVFSPILQPDPENPTLKAFRLSCVTINPGDWIINYGFIETDMTG